MGVEFKEGYEHARTSALCTGGMREALEWTALVLACVCQRRWTCEVWKKREKTSIN